MRCCINAFFAYLRVIFSGYLAFHFVPLKYVRIICVVHWHLTSIQLNILTLNLNECIRQIIFFISLNCYRSHKRVWIIYFLVFNNLIFSWSRHNKSCSRSYTTVPTGVSIATGESLCEPCFRVKQLLYKNNYYFLMSKSWKSHCPLGLP